MGLLPTGNNFTDEEIQDVKEHWFIDCDYFNKLGKKESKRCPDHGYRHRKLPDIDTLMVLLSKYPDKSLQMWADLFGTTRQAVEILYRSHTGENWSTRKLEAIFGKEPDMDLLSKYFDAVASRPNMRKTLIKEFIGVREQYVRYWVRNNDTVKQMYEDAEALRKLAKENPTELKCNRCHIWQPVDAFGNSSKTVHGYSLTCSSCNRASVKTYQAKRKEDWDPKNTLVEKHCPGCLRTRPRDAYYIAKSMPGGLQIYCKFCMDKSHKEHPRRKQKFIDAGISTEDRNCILCNRDRRFYEYYLLVENRYQKDSKKFQGDVCTHCCKDIASELKREQEEEHGIEIYRFETTATVKMRNLMLYKMGDYSNREEFKRLVKDVIQ